MGAVIAKIIFKTGKDKLETTNFSSLNEIPVADLYGEERKTIADYVKDKKLYLVVNVASKWGLSEMNYT